MPTLQKPGFSGIHSATHQMINLCVFWYPYFWAEVNCLTNCQEIPNQINQINREYTYM